ncbi:hypothetical protein Tco_0827607 [Tanacetum coccineum]
MTPTKTKSSASGKLQEEDISPTTLEAATTLSKVASQKLKSVDKGRRYKRRKESKGKEVNTGLDFDAEVSTGFEDINSGYEDISTGFEELNTSSLGVSTGSGPVSTVSTKVLIPSPNKGQREGKAPMIIEETQAPKRTKEQIQQEEASLVEAIRLQTLEEEETAKQIHLDALLAKRLAEEEELTEQQKQRKAQGTWKLTQLKNMSFEEVKEEFDKLVKQIESFIPMNAQPTEEKVAKAKEKEPIKKIGKRRKQITRKGLHSEKTDEDETENDEASEKDNPTSGTNVPINPVLVATKPPSIANYKIIKQGKKGVYQIVRENGTDKVYINFGAMLKVISIDDLIELYRIVMQRYGMNRPTDEYEKVFWGYLKIMFDAGLNIYMLTERSYPLSAKVCKAMLDNKLQGGKGNEDCYQLLKRMENQAGIKKDK